MKEIEKQKLKIFKSLQKGSTLVYQQSTREQQWQYVGLCFPNVAIIAVVSGNFVDSHCEHYMYCSSSLYSILS